MTLEERLRRLEARPPRYDSAEEAERMEDYRNAYAILELNTNACWTPEIERVFRLLASGRITQRQYMGLARAATGGGRGY